MIWPLKPREWCDGTRMSVAIWCADLVFYETGTGLRDALARLGTPPALHAGFGPVAPWAADDGASGASGASPPPRLWVLVGATLLPDGTAPGAPPAWALPRRYVAYQMEQLGSAHFTPRYLDILARAAAVWDFSPRAVEHWRSPAGGGLNAHYVPLSVSDAIHGAIAVRALRERRL